MAPIHYQTQHDRQLEDGLPSYRDEKAGLKEDTTLQANEQTTSKPKSTFRIMNPRRITFTFGLGLLVGFGLVTANRSRRHQPLCSQEIHAANEHEVRALVEQTKDDTSALSEILRCASPETFHRLVSVYFPEQNKSESDTGRAEAIGHDETWLLTAWDKLAKRQDDGAADPSTPSGTATEDGDGNGAGVVTQTTTVTGDGSSSSSDPADEGSTTTDPVPDPETTTSSDPIPDTDTESSTSVEVPPSSSTSEELPESTTEEPVTTSSEVVEETSSSEVPVESTTEVIEETTTTSSEPEAESTTSQEEEPDRPSKTTIHISSSAVKETITSTRPDGGTTTITSTSWVAVDPPENTEESASDPSLQDAGLSLRANVGPVFFVGGIVTMLLMS